MLTFEKVLEIFEDYLAQDMELEVYKSRYGYVCVSFNGSPPDPPYCEGDVCRTPEELFDHLLVEYESFASIQLTKGRREENEADEEQVRRLCQKYLDRREEAMKINTVDCRNAVRHRAITCLHHPTNPSR